MSVYRRHTITNLRLFFYVSVQLFVVLCLQELTEEGLPFLILFHKVDDTAIVEAFNRAVQTELLSEKSKSITNPELWL